MEWVKLGDVVEVQKGKKVSESEHNTGLRYIQIEDLRNDNNIKFTDQENSVKVNTDDVLLAWDGANAGISSYGIEGIIGSTLARIRVKDKYSNIIKSEYLGLFLQFNEKYLRNTANGATIPHVNRGALLNLKLNDVNLEYQQKVIALIRNISNIISTRKAQIAALDELVQSVFYEMFEDVRINEKKFELKYWKEVLKINNGKSQKKVENVNGDYPIYGSGGIMSYADDWLTKENSVIIGRKGNINTPLLVKEKFWHVDTAFGLEPKEDILNVHYLYGFCQEFNFETLNKAVTIPSLTKKDLLEIQIPLPPLELQEQFAAKVEAIEAQKAKLQTSLEEMETLFDALMQEAFSGNLG